MVGLNAFETDATPKIWCVVEYRPNFGHFAYYIEQVELRLTTTSHVWIFQVQKFKSTYIMVFNDICQLTQIQ